MQGLRPYAQDENALAGLHRPAALKAFSGEPALGAPGAKKAGGFPVPSVRKALGNITNRGVFDAENGLPGKTPAAGTAPAQERRALGDITNSSAAAPASLPRTAFKPAVQPAAQQVAAAPASAVAATEPRSRFDELAEGGVEWPAGRGWQALELDRLAREDADIQRRLAALASYRASPLPNFFPLWVRGDNVRGSSACMPSWLTGVPACLPACLPDVKPAACGVPTIAGWHMASRNATITLPAGCFPCTARTCMAAAFPAGVNPPFACDLQMRLFLPAPCPCAGALWHGADAGKGRAVHAAGLACQARCRWDASPRADRSSSFAGCLCLPADDAVRLHCHFMQGWACPVAALLKVVCYRLLPMLQA